MTLVRSPQPSDTRQSQAAAVTWPSTTSGFPLPKWHHQSLQGNGAKRSTAQTIPHSARSMGIYHLGSRGSGKSRFDGRVIAFQDYIAGIPQLILDPVGSTIDNFLDKLLRFLRHIPQELHHHCWSRILYVEMSGTNRVVPWPLYYKLGSESLRDIAERYLRVILMSNPSLLNAQVQGWPPLHRIGVYTGMVLSALGYQITSAMDLLRDPEQWVGRFPEAQARYPEVAEAVSFFKDEYIPSNKRDRERLTNPFFDKIFQFLLDPRLQAMFGPSQPGIVWDEVESKKQTVLLDFRQEQDLEMRRFKMLWAFSYLYEWIKRRGRSETPFGLIIDEFAALTQNQAVGNTLQNPLANLMDEFINVYMRQHSIWFSCIHQELFQIDERLRNTLLSLGTHIVGRQSNMDACRILADHLMFTDPYQVKHSRKVWGNANPRFPSYFVLDIEPVFLPLDEQRELFAQRINTQGLFQFLLRPAEREGAVSRSVIPISIASVDRDKETGEWLFPDQQVLSRLRPLLAQASGRPLAELLEANPPPPLTPRTTRRVELPSGSGNGQSYSQEVP